MKRRNEAYFEFVVRVTMNELYDDDVPIVRQTAKQQLRPHIEEAVTCWGGQLHPSDFLHTRNIKSVKVTTRKGT